MTRKSEFTLPPIDQHMHAHKDIETAKYTEYLIGLASQMKGYSKAAIESTDRITASVDSVAAASVRTMTIDVANAAAHSWRGNIYAVKKYRNIADPNIDNFSEHLNRNIRKSDKGSKLRY